MKKITIGLFNDSFPPMTDGVGMVVDNYARRLSKMNISSTNWNINQLGDMLTYPDVMEIEA